MSPAFVACADRLPAGCVVWPAGHQYAGRRFQHVYATKSRTYRRFSQFSSTEAAREVERRGHRSCSRRSAKKSSPITPSTSPVRYVHRPPCPASPRCARLGRDRPRDVLFIPLSTVPYPVFLEVPPSFSRPFPSPSPCRFILISVVAPWRLRLPPRWCATPLPRPPPPPGLAPPQPSAPRGSPPPCGGARLPLPPCRRRT